MPVSYEPLNVNTDVTTTKTILHEVIPLTGTIINSGTYNNENIKNNQHNQNNKKTKTKKSNNS